MGEGNETILGAAGASFTPVSDTRRVTVQVKVCDLQVRPAAPSILGNCTYYYRPLHGEYVDKTGVSTWDAVKAWATRWNPWDDMTTAARLLRNRDRLIRSGSTDGDWSRHANFMMRHVGCGHRPPDYYVSYGYYYCSIYGAKLQPRLSKGGKAWLEKARKLLQQNMDDGLKDNMSNDEIVVQCKRYPSRTAHMSAPRKALEIHPARFKTFAFRTHVPAYLDAGLADLPISDLAKIGGQPNLEEWLDRETWEQAIDSGMEVGNDKLGHGINAARQLAGRAVDATREGADHAGRALQGALDALTRKFR